jgi:hypothetical protein
VTAEWRKIHSEELHNFYFPLNSIGNIIANRMSFGTARRCVMRLYIPTKFLLVILQRTSRCVNALITNLYRTVKHNQVLRSRINTY